MQSRSRRGLTLIELLIGLAIAAILVAVAVPAYQNYRERARIAQAVSDIANMHANLRTYILDNKAPPPSLAAIGASGKLDPWGRPYAYLNLVTAGVGKARKNKNLVPINTLFDLYSTGKDGGSTPPLTAANSRDDIILANDGGFVGKVTDYE